MDKWISTDQSLLDGLVLPVGDARRSGSPVRGCRTLETTRDLGRVGCLPRPEEPDFTAIFGSDMGPVPAPAPDISKHRVLMKNVESMPNSDGAVTLTSKRFNIKLDKETTYVLAAGDLAHGPG